jgi:hypothetical protein
VDYDLSNYANPNTRTRPRGSNERNAMYMAPDIAVLSDEDIEALRQSNLSVTRAVAAVSRLLK